MMFEGPVRTWLFAPLSRPDRCLKALGSPADQTIWDLEDSISPVEKAQARSGLRALWAGASVRGAQPWIRINSPLTPDGVEDLALLDELGAGRLMVPKADSQTLAMLWRRVPWLGLVLIVETAAGLDSLPAALLKKPDAAETRLAFGALDYRLDVGGTEAEDEADILWARSQIVWLSRARGLAAPIDSVYAHYRDDTGLRRSAQRARSLGFAGKLAIHPNQIGVLNEMFRPSAAECAWARQVMDAIADSGVAGVGGMMVDRPVIERARRILDTERRLSRHLEADDR